MLKHPRNGFGRCIVSVALSAIALPIMAAQAPASATRGDQQARMLDARVNYRQSYQRATGARPGSADTALERAKKTSATIVSAIGDRKKSMPGLDVRLSGITGAPEVVRNGRGTLTSTSGARNETIVRGFLSQNKALYGLSSADLNDLVVLGDSAGGRSGLRMLRMEQRIDGRPIFQSETRFLIDRTGRLVSSTGRMMPNARAARPQVNSEITPAQAIAKLLGIEGRSASVDSFSVTPAAGEWIHLSETDDYVAGTAFARQMYFPLGPGQLVPAWAVIVFTEGEHDWYAIVDSETGDVLWRKNIRHSASAHDARFRVFVQADGRTPADSPAPGTPNALTPGSNTQFPFLPPTIVSMHAVMDPVASPNGWINDCPGGVCTAAETQTQGNNVLACLDRTVGAGASNVCDTDANSILDGNGRPTGNPDANGRDRDFLGTVPRDFQTTFLPPPQTTAADAEVGQNADGDGTAFDVFRRGAVTHLFYVSNWYHDELFALGFDEASANFQQTNFSGMGLGGDRVNADAQDGSGTNNANFSTPPDGTPGRMQMYRFPVTAAAPDRDASLDAEIVVHELTHGTSNRLVGNAAGLNWDVAAAMGEGWSDFYALSMLNNTNADDPNGQYAEGGYATYKMGGNSAFQDNYIYGIRRFPYSTVNTINPTTWADVDDVTNDLSGGIAPDPRGINIVGGLQVHNAGTVWALSLWEVRSRVIADPAGANGDVPTGNTTMLQLVTDALKLTPIDPSFIDARNALFDADCATNACANEESIWAGFADRGLGYKAAAPYRFVLASNFGGHMAIRESFTVPYLDVIDVATDVTIDDSASNNNGAIDPGEALYLNVRLTNPWRNASKAVAAGAVATLSTSTPGVTIWDNTATYPAIAANGSALANDTFTITVDTTALAGQSLDFTLSINSSLGVTATEFKLRVGNRNGTDPLVTYTKDTSPDLAIPDVLLSRGESDTMVVTDDLEIADIDFRLDSFTHDFVGDITVMLRSPRATGVDLISMISAANGFGGTNIIDMVIDDDLPVTVANDMYLSTNSMAPYTGDWLPIFNAPWSTLLFGVPDDTVGNLSYLDGESTQGTWTVFASDQWAPDAGTLDAWSLLVTPVHFDVTAFAPAAVFDPPSKVVTGVFEVGGTVTYTVTITNSGTDAQNDNTGDEFIDVLPPSLTLVNAISNSGTAVANVGTNTVTWNGSLAPLGGSVTITITATINAGTQGTMISNQGTVYYDSNNDNDNDAQSLTDDPFAGGTADPTTFIVANAVLSATKSVSAGPYGPGDSVTYTITINNTGNTASSDNAGDELTDVLPSSLTLTSATANSGAAAANTGTNTVTWNGSVPAGGSVTVTINATIDAGTQGTTISNQGTVSYDSDLDGANESSASTDDPSTGTAGDGTEIEVSATALDTLTKTVSGTFEPGSIVTYTIVITNAGDTASPDNPGDELTDVLPSELTLTSTSATSGTAVANTGTNTVTWNGAVPPGGSVTITINALLETVPPGTTVTNQATLLYDSDGSGDNETTVLSDDPSIGGAADPTSFVTAAAAVAGVPTASELGLLLLALTLAVLAIWKVRLS